MSDSNPVTDVSESAIDAVRQWISEVVIAHNFCPFASAAMTSTAARLVTVAGNLQGILDVMDGEVKKLETSATLDTSLIIVTDGLFEFDDYLDMLFIAETHLTGQAQDEHYQIASFHPHYCFEGNDPKDLENYTNRAPYPVFQLLKETSVTRELAQFRDPEAIPDRNISRLLDFDAGQVAKIKALSNLPQPRD